MPVPYTFDPRQKTIDCRPHGDVQMAEVVEFFDSVLADEAVSTGAIEVVYLDGVDEFRFTAGDAHLIPVKISELRVRKGVIGTVFVAEGPLSFGMARMFTTLHEIADASHPVRIVRSALEAEAAIAAFVHAGEGS